MAKPWKLTVYDWQNSTSLGVLQEEHGVTLKASSSRLASFLTFQLDYQSTDDLALLRPRRVIRVTDGLLDLGAYFVHEMPSVEKDPDENPGVSFQCLSLENWLGTGRVGGAVVFPAGGTVGKEDVEIGGRWDPRKFGPFDADFDDSLWIEGPNGAGPLTTEGWPDDRAEAFEFTDQAIYRRTIPAGDALTGPARMFLAARWDVEATVYRNSAAVLTKPYGETGLFAADVAYDGLGETIAVDVKKVGGGVGRFGWTWMRLDVGTDGDGNEVYTVGDALRRTFDPADFPGATPWRQVNNYETLPGVTVGYVLDELLTEAQSRGALANLSWAFTPFADSGGVPWTEEFSHSFRLGSTYGWVAEQLLEFNPGTAFRVTSDGTLLVEQQPGSDLTGSVTLDRLESASLSGDPVSATAMLTVTPNGVSRDNRPLSIIAYGRVESAATFGTADRPGAIEQLADDLLDRMSEPQHRAELVLSEASPQPFDDFELDDQVTFESYELTAAAFWSGTGSAWDGTTVTWDASTVGLFTGTVREIVGAQNDSDGSVDWTVLLDEVST